MFAYLTSERRRLLALSTSILAAGAVLAPASLTAQELEEIVVTAERRVQTLQEVPISVDVYTGDEIDLQGFRSLDDLSKFSTSVQISNGVQEQNVAIRSFSTRGNSLTLESAAPLFLDGVHFGRMSMVKTAFLDTERVEILKGPQPLHFGMNATAGAFNIQSARPTQVWEGNLAAEFGNYGKRELTGAVSGPITDTLAFRLAGIYEGSDGPVFNRYNPEERLPRFHHLGGRASLQWEPREDLTIFSKVERSRQRNGSELTMGCLTGATLSGFGDEITDGEFDPALTGLYGNEQSVFANPPQGIGGIGEIINPEVTDPEDCFKGNLAFGRGGPYQAPPENVVSSQASRRPRDGSVDSRALHALFYSQDGPESLPGVGGADHGGVHGFDGKDWVDTWNGLFDVNFQFANGVNLNSQSGFVKLDRLASRDFVLSPFAMGYQPKMEDYDQFSQLIRFDSPAEGFDMGAVNVEFMVSGFYQQGSLEFWNGNSEGGGIRRPMRFNNGWEDSKWWAGSWNLTFNVLDDQLSLSVGGRYTDVEKHVYIFGWGAQFIFDERPCDSTGTDSDVATCTTDPHFYQITAADLNSSSVVWADPSRDMDERVRADNPQLLLPTADLDNLWVPTRWGSRAITGVPLNYRNGRVPAVGYTAPNYRNNIPEPWNVVQSADDYDTQVVLSFTPNGLERNHTFYGKYVEAFKGPVTDTGQGGLPLTFAELAFEPEYVTAWEVGAKGMLMGRRMRYDFDVFRNTFTDLQTIGAAPLFNPQDQTSVSLNAGEQRVDGVEFNIQYAASENLILDLGGSFLDGKFQEFEGDGCSGDESLAAAINALANPGSYSADEIDAAQEIIDDLDPSLQANLPAASEIPAEYFISGGCNLVDSPEFEAGTSSVGGAGTISRTGVTPPDSPDYRFVFGATYTRPISDRLEAMVNVKGFIADSFRSGRSNNPTVSTFYDSGFNNMDLNLTAGVGSQDGNWRVVAYMRNLLENTEIYHPEYEIIQDGLVTNTMSDNSFRSYGLRFEYQR